MFVGLLFWFQFHCGFSASAMIDQWYLIFFNLLFSSLPQLVTGVLDQDVPADVLLTEPQLYKSGQNMEVSLPAPLASHPWELQVPRPLCADDWGQLLKLQNLASGGGGKKPILPARLQRKRRGGRLCACPHPPRCVLNGFVYRFNARLKRQGPRKGGMQCKLPTASLRSPRPARLSAPSLWWRLQPPRRWLIWNGN